jgi:diacylglycerol kinase family enzyme
MLDNRADGRGDHPHRMMRSAWPPNILAPVAKPATSSRRLWAFAALALLAAAVVLALVLVVISFPRGLLVLLCLCVAVVSAWYGVQRRGPRRVAGLAAAALLSGGAIALIFLEGTPVLNALVLATFVASLAAAKRSFAVHEPLPAASAPSHPVLFYNPLSGDGKAERFHLADEARKRRIDAIELHRGDDLEQLVRTAVRQGADALAMAGGDGSQAIVAKVAAELDLPYACIPAGTRNHFALDLGVDRDDVVGALDAFVEGGERRVDLAEVNGQIFVNNVSLGMYAEAVQEAGYRNAKLRTLLDTVPTVLGPDAVPAAVHWQGKNGEESGVAVLVSNNPYRLGRAIGSGTRPRLDRGTLGIAVFGGAEAGSAQAQRRVALRQWSDESFEVRSEKPVAAGVDGEAMTFDPPLQFRSRPAALRVRIAPAHPGASPSAIEPDSLWLTIRSLATFAFGG